jgi:hypothetical protein
MGRNTLRASNANRAGKLRVRRAILPVAEAAVEVDPVKVKVTSEISAVRAWSSSAMPVK